MKKFRFWIVVILIGIQLFDGVDVSPKNHRVIREVVEYVNYKR